MLRLTLGADVCWNIAGFCTTGTRRQLLQSCSAVYAVVCPVLYRHIEVEKTALKLIESLANNNHLPRMIRSLIFRDSFATQVISTQWTAVLVAMTNLERLVICRTIPLPLDILPSITFQLKSFGCAGSVVGPWTEFVRSQTVVEELFFDSDFFGPAPGPALLPQLRRMKGLSSDLARFARYHPLCNLWFYLASPHQRRALDTHDLDLFALSPARLSSIRIGADQFVQLFHAAPNLVTNVSDGDVQLSFSHHRVHSPHLVGRAEGIQISRALSDLCSAPLLQKFRVDAYDGSACWDR
ncbi:hypothetical protein B0H14DRAFT_3482607 [Mycena olivaceomarginata]|nr:hypothetical protein B0H14DRAFT_3482607 [Mycena olivaceomarginata]